MIESTFNALKPIETVLIASSLTPDSDQVVDQGVRLARRLGATAILTHAVQPQAASSVFGLEWTDGLAIESYREEAAERLRAQGSRHDLQDCEPGRFPTELGPPHRAILRVARAARADLIVVGPHESSRHLQRLLGSTAERVVRGAQAPIVIVRGELTLDRARVVAPVDLSDLSADSFRCGLSFLWQLGARSAEEVEALFVLSEWQREQAPQFSARQVDRLAKEELDDFLSRNTGDYPGEVAARVTVGAATDKILERLDETAADLVVIGTHGHSGFERLVIGSVTTKVARQARCSLLVIPPLTAFESERRLTSEALLAP